MRKIASIILSLFVITSCLTDENIKDSSLEPVSHSAIVLNEILPTTSLKWIEIYNPTEEDINISSYFLSNKSNRFQIPDSTITGSKSYLVILCDGQNVKDESGIHANFTIEEGDIIKLEDAENLKIEEISLPDMDFGISWGRLKTSNIAWEQFIPSPGEFNDPERKAGVSEIWLSPEEPTNIDKTKVYAKLAVLSPVQSVVLYYDENETNTSEFGMMSPSDGKYNYLIPKYPTGTTISYYLEVVDSDGNSSVYPKNAPDNKLRYVVQNHGPYISSVAANPAYPTETNAVTVTAIITDKVAIGQATLVYIDPAGHTEISLVMSNTGNVYSAQIPAMKAGSIVYYYVKARNSNNISSFYPEGAPTTKLDYIVTSK